MMSALHIEVIGSEPPCKKCKLMKERAEKAASGVTKDNINVEITKSDIMSPDIAKKYGVVTSPALAINGVVKVMGRVPEIDEIERILKQALT